jgi:hypothetical protein
MNIDPKIKERLIGLESSYIEPYLVQVQGESQYRANFEKICGYVDEEEGYEDNAHQASLYFEDNNSFDLGNAVRVEIDDLTVGYLSKPQAKTYRQKLKEIQAPENPIAICSASIRGGFRKKDGEVADYGVRLDFDLSNLKLVPVRYRDEGKKSLPPIPVASIKPAQSPLPLPANPLTLQQNISKFIKWTFSSWWKALLVLLSISFVCGMCQAITQLITGK